MEAVGASIVECGVAARARPGETICGDVHVVAPRGAGVLVAALDGLGHGKEAALAASTAKCCLEEQPQKPVALLVAQCHRTLQSTRGAVMSVATFDSSTDSMAWLGVGNVQGVLLRRTPEGWRESSLLLRSGVVGSGMLPEIAAEELQIAPGDTLVLATDGIDTNFSREIAVNQPPQRAAEAILARYGKSDDDALVLVTRYVGKGTKRAKHSPRARRGRSE